MTNIIPFPASRWHARVLKAADGVWSRRERPRLSNDYLQRIEASVRTDGRTSGLSEVAIDQQVAEFISAVRSEVVRRERQQRSKI